MTPGVKTLFCWIGLILVGTVNIAFDAPLWVALVDSFAYGFITGFFGFSFFPQLSR